MMRFPLRLSLALLLLGVPSTVIGQWAAVYQDEARFFLPVSDAELGWNCSDAFGKLQYAWVVETIQSGAVVRFGYTAWGGRSTDRLSFPQMIRECGQVNVWGPEGSSWRVMDGLRVEALPMLSAMSAPLLVLRITDPETLATLFPRRRDDGSFPIQVRFVVEGLRVEGRETELTVWFFDHPAPPTLWVFPLVPRA